MKKQFAEMLNGRQRGEEITKTEERLAKDNNLVVVFGYSDDSAEFRGAIYDEVGCYDGGTIYINGNEVLGSYHSCDCDHCGFAKLKQTAQRIDAVWGGEEYSWTYKTEIPHATFDVMEGDEKFCRGIVFNLNELK